MWEPFSERRLVAVHAPPGVLHPPDSIFELQVAAEDSGSHVKLFPHCNHRLPSWATTFPFVSLTAPLKTPVSILET
jgi:hypothetical protein